MSYTIRKVEVWAGDFVNRAGVLARVLEALTGAGAQLEFLIGRRVTEHTSRIFLAPLKGKRQKEAAGAVGRVVARGLNSVRVEGPDRAGLGAGMSRALATEGINIRGVSAAAIGRNSVFYFAFKTEVEANQAMGVLRKTLRPRKRR
jgi:predicted amino acid-binding ACT domain protein